MSNSLLFEWNICFDIWIHTRWRQRNERFYFKRNARAKPNKRWWWWVFQANCQWMHLHSRSKLIRFVLALFIAAAHSHSLKLYSPLFDSQRWFHLNIFHLSLPTTAFYSISVLWFIYVCTRMYLSAMHFQSTRLFAIYKILWAQMEKKEKIFIFFFLFH